MRFSTLTAILICLTLTCASAVTATGGVGTEFRALSTFAFTENRGQVVDTDGEHRPEILYTASIPGVTLYVSSQGISYVYTRVEYADQAISEATGKSESPRDGLLSAHPEIRRESTLAYYRMDMHLVGGNSDARIRAERRIPGYSNYYYPHCPGGVSGVRSYGQLTLENVYENIDMVLSCGGDRMKYEFIVHPGGDPASIRMRYDGVVTVRPAGDGGIEVITPLGSIREEAPYSFQRAGKVASGFRVHGSDVTFDVGAYDVSRTLVIDPWSTFFGGTGAEYGRGIDTDAHGNVTICGGTSSVDFPVHNAQQGSIASYVDAYVVQFDSTGVRRWATYYGGSADEVAYELEVDAGGNIAVVGATISWDFPVEQAAQPKIGSPGADDAFVLKLRSDGTRLWCTYLGGGDTESCFGVTSDGSGNVYVTGGTQSTDFPVANAHQPTKSGMMDAYVTKFSSTGAVQWATYFGGYQNDDGVRLDAEPSGNIVVCGATSSTNFPVLNALQPAIASGGADDAFISKFNTQGVPVWSTYYGGTASEHAHDVAIDGNGNVIVTGLTYSLDFPVLTEVQRYISGQNDAFIVKLDAQGTLNWATYCGGSGGDCAYRIDTDNRNDICIAGVTSSTDFPVRSAWQPTGRGGSDAFVVKFHAAGTVAWATYLGGQGYDQGNGVATDPNRNVIVAGGTYSDDFPVFHAWQDVRVDSTRDAFYTSLSPDGILMPLYPPADPTDLTATAVTPSTVLLQWTDHADNESEYVIEVQFGASIWEEAAIDTANATQHTMRGLIPETQYAFRVKARSWSHASKYSNVAQLTMPVFKAPTRLRPADISSNTVSLIWTDQSAHETGFLIQLREGGGPWTAVDTVKENATECTVTGLRETTTYSFRVCALEGEIPSAWSNTVQATTMKFLAAPTQLTAALLDLSSVRLTWIDNATAEEQYEIEQRLKGGAWTLAATTAADAEAHKLTGLVRDTVYYFRVRAMGDNAASSYSTEVMVVTRMTPAAPVNLVASAVNHASVYIVWEARSSNEDRFELQRRDDGGDWIQIHSVSAGETELCDEGLDAGTLYWYRVRAVNDRGPSPWSNQDSARTLGLPVPGRPFGISAEALDAYSIQISWVLPHPSYEDGCEMQESLTGDEGDFVTVTPHAAQGERSYERNGLEPETTYYFRVRAYNAGGASAWSEIVHATTLEENLDLPAVPADLQAEALGTSEIRLTWEMPSQSNESGFEIQRSATGLAA